MKFERKLKVSKTGAYELDVKSWALGDPLVSSSVSSDGKCTIDSQSELDGVISFTATGITTGDSLITFEFATATTNDCATATIVIIEDC